MENFTNDIDFTNLADIPEECKQTLKPLSAKEKTDAIKKLITNAIKNAIIPGFYYAACDVRLLTIDMTYQRIPKDLNKLVKNFDIKKLGALTVSYRNGKLYIIDGFHRLYVCILNGIQILPINILTDQSQKDEAEIFAKQDNGTTNLSNEDKYKANLVWGDPCDTAIRDICNKYGLNPLDPEKKYRPALSACRPIMETDGKDALDWVMNILYKSKWSTMPCGCSHKIISGLQNVYRYTKADNSLTTASENLIQTLSKNSIPTIDAYGRAVAQSNDKRAMMRTALLNIATGECNAATLTLFDRANTL